MLIVRSTDFAKTILLISCVSLIHGKLVILNWESRPQQLITFSGLISTNEQYTLLTDNNTTKYKISIALERMIARTCDSNKEHPVVVINQGLEFDTFCFQNVSYKPNDALSPSYAFDGTVQIEAAGSWGPSEDAQLIATIFLEVPSCSYCPAGAFCCQGEAACNGANSEKIKTHLEDNSFSAEIHSPAFAVNSGLLRCIPEALECNGHSNCGKICTADESSVKCSAVALYAGLPVFLTVILILISRILK